MNKKNLFFLLLLGIGLFSCNGSTELPILNGAKTADIFSRAFISKIISGQPDSAFLDVNKEVLNDKMKESITNASLNLNGAVLKKYRVVEEIIKPFFSTNGGNFTTYRLGYEYEFEQGNVLFLTVIKEEQGKFGILSFNGMPLSAPLTELTKFTLSEKSEFELLFATWHSMYLTGKIVARTII